MPSDVLSSLVFTFAESQHQVRIFGGPEHPWFCAADICAVLGIANSRDAIIGLDSDEKGVGITDTLGGLQEITIISESGLYALIFRSRKPQAKAFRRWITGEVIPALRRQGHYSMAGAGESASSGTGLSPAVISSLTAALDRIATHMERTDVRIDQLESRVRSLESDRRSKVSRLPRLSARPARYFPQAELPRPTPAPESPPPHPDFAILAALAIQEACPDPHSTRVGTITLSRLLDLADHHRLLRSVLPRRRPRTARLQVLESRLNGAWPIRCRPHPLAPESRLSLTPAMGSREGGWHIVPLSAIF